LIPLKCRLIDRLRLSEISMSQSPKSANSAVQSETDLVAAILLRFDRNWGSGQLETFAAEISNWPAELRRRTLALLVKIDLERRWQSGQPLNVEQYLTRFPDLGTVETVAPELLLAEWEARRHKGETPRFGDFSRRFPQQAPALQQLLQQAESGESVARGEVSASVSHRETPRPSRVSTASMSPANMSPNAASVPSMNTTRRELSGRFGKYEIRRRLGKGGMGEVYLAYDPKADREVAVKIPQFADEESVDVIQRFYREVRVAATIQHPNICPIWEVDEVNGVPYLAMPFIQGETLDARLKKRTKPLDERTIAQLIRKLALALAEAHRLGIIHRDLKPANIMFDHRKEPIVMDFGLARRAGQAESKLTKPGMIVGTPAYMPVEQVQAQDELIGPASDVYSLGVILYELLTGRLPFDGPPLSVLALILTAQPDAPRNLRSELDPRLEAICLKAIAKQPADRYQSMTEFAAALGEYLKAPSAPRPAGDVSSSVPSATVVNATSGPTLDNRTEASFEFPVFGEDEPPATSVRPTALKKTPANSLKTTVLVSAQQVRTRWSRLPFAAQVVALCASFGFLLGIILWFRSGDALVKVEVHSEDVEVTFHNETLKLSDGPHEYKVSPGDHTLHIKSGNAEFDTEKFTLKKGENPAVTIELVKGDVVAKQGKTTISKRSSKSLAGIKPKAMSSSSNNNGRTKNSPAESFSDWELSQPYGESTWSVRDDGVLMGSGRGWLGTKDFYGDFELSLEYELPSSGSSGVFLWASGTGTSDGKEFLEVQLLDDGERKNRTTDISQLTGSLFKIAARQSTLNTKPNEWHRLLVRATGARVVVEHDGTPAVDVNLDNVTIPAGIKRQSRGRIGLQSSDTAGVHFRNVTIRSLASTAAKPASNLSTTESTDLLQQIDLARDIISGAWTKSEDKLATPSGKNACVVLPADVVPEEYELTVTAERVGGTAKPSRYSNLTLFLVFGGKEAAVVLDSEQQSGPCSGLNLLNGLKVGENSTTWRKPVLQPRRPTTVVCTVRKERIVVENSGETIIDWQGKPDAISHDPNWTATLPKGRLGIGSWDGRFEIARITLRPLAAVSAPEKGSGSVNSPQALSPAKTTLPDKTAGKPKPAIAPFDATQAKKYQEDWAASLKVPIEYENTIGMKTVLIPPGEFTMGRMPGESARFPPNGLYQEPAPTQHKVTLTRPFRISTTEVTRRQWREVMGSEPWRGKDKGPDGDDYPANHTSKPAARDFCKRLSEKEGKTYRLPTEAEWEFACRAGSETLYFFGEDRAQVGEYACLGRLQTVATKKPNRWGLFDMYGNLWEWVADGRTSFTGEAAVDPLLNPGDEMSIIRGSCFRSAIPGEFSSGARHAWPGGLATDEKGFRVVCEVDQGRVAPAGSGTSSNSGGAAKNATKKSSSTSKSTAKPADAFQSESEWVSDDGYYRLTVLDRKGATFRARFRNEATVEANKVDREVSGTIKDNKVTWLAKDVRPTKGGQGGDNFGTLDKDALDVRWSDKSGGSGTFTLRLKSGGK
jgi:serine/threonine protein kinase/formylglycine-generating enzyme required for sulfatase activity